MIDCLQQHPDSQQIDQQRMQAFNQTLLTNYWQFWQQKQLHDDSYFYYHFMDHALKTPDNRILENIMTDLRWIIGKVSVCKTLTSLFRDLRHYMQSIHIEDQQVSYDKYQCSESLFLANPSCILYYTVIE